MTSNSSVDKNHKFQQVSDKILEKLGTGNKVLGKYDDDVISKKEDLFFHIKYELNFTFNLDED